MMSSASGRLKAPNEAMAKQAAGKRIEGDSASVAAIPWCVLGRSDADVLTVPAS
jgi:hypothetical protein